MKPLFKLSLAVSCFIFILFSCNKSNDSDPKNDKTKPVITLKGDADMSIGVGSNTPDPGANATDNIDGDISSAVNSDWNTAVDQNISGSYTVKYSVKDKAGNEGTTTRKVNVKPMAGNLAGNYKTTLSTAFGSSGVFDATVTAGSSAAQIVLYPVYGGFYVTADLKGSLNEELTFDCVDQSIHFKGTGKITNNGKNIDLTGTIFTSTSNQNFTQNFWKQ